MSQSLECTIKALQEGRFPSAMGAAIHRTLAAAADGRPGQRGAGKSNNQEYSCDCCYAVCFGFFGHSGRSPGCKEIVALHVAIRLRIPIFICLEDEAVVIFPWHALMCEGSTGCRLLMSRHGKRRHMMPVGGYVEVLRRTRAGTPCCMHGPRHNHIWILYPNTIMVHGLVRNDVLQNFAAFYLR